MKPIIPEGGYFMIADWSALGEASFSPLKKNSDIYLCFIEPYADLSEKKYPQKDYCFVEWLTRVKKLAAIPPTAFYSAEDKHLGENCIRFCFIKVISNIDLVSRPVRVCFKNWIRLLFAGGCQPKEGRSYPAGMEEDHVV